MKFVVYEIDYFRSIPVDADEAKIQEGTLIFLRDKKIVAAFADKQWKGFTECQMEEPTL